MANRTRGLLVRPTAADAASPAARRDFVERLARFTTVADELGFDEFWLEEPPPLAMPSVGPFALLGFLAARTPMALGAVLPAASERIPSITAKLIASLDVVSGGRAMAALTPSRSAGAAATTFSPRDLEAVRLIETLLAEEAVTMSGEFYAVQEAWNEPRVPQRATPLYLVWERAGDDPERPAMREFTPYDPARGAELESDAAPRWSDDGDGRAVVYIAPTATPGEIVRQVKSGEQHGIVFACDAPLDPERLSLILAAAETA